MEATGAALAPFDPEYDAHDLMVANPERETAASGARAGVKDDLRRIFVGPLTGPVPRAGPRSSPTFPADVIVVDTMFLGALPSPSGPRSDRPALACIGVMPYPACSRDTAPFGIALQPGKGPLFRLRNRTLNLLPGASCWATSTASPGPVWPRPAVAGRSGFVMDLPAKGVDAYLQARGGVRVSTVGPAGHRALRGAGPRPPRRRPSPAPRGGVNSPDAPGGPCHAGHPRQCRPGPAVAPNHAGPGPPRCAGGGHHGGPDPEPLRRACPQGASSASSPITCCCHTST